MSAGSQRFAFVQYPDTPRVCAACSRSVRVADVGRVHTVIDYSSYFLCAEHVHAGYGDGFLDTAAALTPQSAPSLPNRG